MTIRNRFASAFLKAALAAGAWAGILLQCGVFSGQANFSSLRYYTLLSNLLVAAYFSLATAFALQGKPVPFRAFKGALTMGITVTGLVFHLMLSRSAFGMGSSAAVANQLLHTFTPLATVLDWLLFDEKGRYTKRSPLQWTILPNMYLVLATVYGFTSGDRFYGGSRFPYFFMDYDALGVGRVLCYALGLNVAFIALGYVFLWIDARLTHIGSSKESPENPRRVNTREG